MDAFVVLLIVCTAVVLLFKILYKPFNSRESNKCDKCN